MFEGLLLVDLPFAQTLRMVHRRPERRRTKGRDQRAGNTYIHHAIFPQVRFTNDDVGTYIYSSQYFSVYNLKSVFEL